MQKIFELYIEECAKIWYNENKERRMKNYFKICLVAIIALTSVIFAGCKDEYSIYLFTSQGGSIIVNDSQDKIRTKDILYRNKSCEIKLQAVADDGYEFEHWLVDSEVFSTEPVVTLKINQETVIKSIFKKFDSEQPVDPTDPTDPTEPVDPSEPTDPVNPTPDDPTPSEPVDPTPDQKEYVTLNFVFNLFDSDQSASIVESSDNHSTKNSTYTVEKDYAFKFKIEESATNQSHSKMIAKAINDDSNYVLMTKDSDGYYLFTPTFDQTILIVQVNTVVVSINYGEIQEQNFEIYFDPDTEFKNDFDTGLCYDEIIANPTDLCQFIASEIVTYANQKASEEFDNWKIRKILISNGSTTATFEVIYSDEISVQLSSGELTSNLLENDLVLHWQIV